MKINEAKEQFNNQSMELMKEYGYSFEPPKVGTQNMSFKTNGGTISIKLQSTTTFNHIFLQATENFHRKYAINSEEKKFIEKQFTLALQYWGSFCKAKKHDGFIVYVERGFNQELYKIITNLPGISLNEAEKETLLYGVLNKADLESRIIGLLTAQLGEDCRERINKFYESSQILLSTINEEPLLHMDTSIFDLFHPGALAVSYHGQSFAFQFHPSFEKIKISYIFNTEDAERPDDIVMLVNKEAIREALATVREQNRMLTLINPPMENFQRLLKVTFNIMNDKVIKKAFEEFCEELGSWEVAETESFYLLKNASKTKLNAISDEVTRKEFKLYKFTGKDRYYYAVYTAQEKVLFEEIVKFYISDSDKEIPEEIQEFMLDYLLKGNREKLSYLED